MGTDGRTSTGEFEPGERQGKTAFVDERLARVVRRANLRMSRSYAGSGERLKSVLKRAMLGEELKLAAIGGSGGYKARDLWPPIRRAMLKR